MTGRSNPSQNSRSKSVWGDIGIAVVAKSPLRFAFTAKAPPLRTMQDFGIFLSNRIPKTTLAIIPWPGVNEVEARYRRCSKSKKSDKKHKHPFCRYSTWTTQEKATTNTDPVILRLSDTAQINIKDLAHPQIFYPAVNLYIRPKLEPSQRQPHHRLVAKGTPLV
jgi:hypothetical protein